MEELDNIIVLDDEAGNQVRFEFLDLIDYAGEEYLLLLPENDESGEVVILRVEETDDPELEAYAAVEDEDTLLAVFAVFKEKYADEFNFAD